jgi:hypothetical protein
MLYLMAVMILSVIGFRIYRAWRYGYSTVAAWNDALRMS